MKNVLSVLTIVGCMVISLNGMALEPLSLQSVLNAEALTHFDASEDVQRTAQV